MAKKKCRPKATPPILHVGIGQQNLPMDSCFATAKEYGAAAPHPDRQQHRQHDLYGLSWNNLGGLPFHEESYNHHFVGSRASQGYGEQQYCIHNAST